MITVENETSVDVAIIGAGVAGSTAAAALANRGVSVALIASHARHPPEYRAEKIGEQQMAMFDAAGLGPAARAVFTPFDGVWVRRFGQIVSRDDKREYGADYAKIVDALRGGLPDSVRQIIGRVETIETGADGQTITLADDRTVRARLLVMATGLSEAALKKAGMRREVYSKHHSLTAGFDLSRPAADFPFPSLVWSGEGPTDNLSYLTLFPIGTTLRANLFVYRSPFEDWTKALRDDPNGTLNAMLPKFEAEYGELAVAGPVMIRPIDLARTLDTERDGVVVVGDAFMTVCPITGTGMDKALNDVTILARDHIANWLATPGMAASKIAQFYADPAKRERDETAIRISVESRAVRFDPGLRWRLRRLRAQLFGRFRYMLPASIGAAPHMTSNA